MQRSYDRGASDSLSASLVVLARLKAGLSQRELAKRAGVPVTMVSAYERGRREATLPTLRRLLRAAGFDLRTQLAPVDVHDETLQVLEDRRTADERRARDQQIDLWRNAVPVISLNG
ncbi:MAG TPA: helix-turn-helix transcriptional regulator [Candidatus Dormibacteraeota bacterium]|nr:helix-turn-helix transcriptional regulator [Candidatus Dormibacteraeota bacterium]